MIRHHAWPFCPDGSAGRTDKPVCSSWCLAGAASSPGASLGRPIGAVCWRLQGARGGPGPLTLHAGEVAEGEAMTEDEWLECTDPAPMLDFLRGKATDRKLRLFACACCRRIWHFMTDMRSREAVAGTELFADGQINEDEYIAVMGPARDVGKFETVGGANQPSASAIHAATAAYFSGRTVDMTRWVADHVYFLPDDSQQSDTSFDVLHSAKHAVWAVNAGKQDTRCNERAAHSNLLRDIFGNPFRPVVLDLARRKPTVTALAQAAYDERIQPSGTLDPARLAVLADSLEEAGCDNADILAHLRGPGPHVRGCWVVDLLLDKE